MEYLGIHYEVDNIPELDSEFIPLGKWMEAFLKQAFFCGQGSGKGGVQADEEAGEG